VRDRVVKFRFEEVRTTSFTCRACEGGNECKASSRGKKSEETNRTRLSGEKRKVGGEERRKKEIKI
jgi:hypothetical protein